ncbi:hypothetical protein IQ07DRAFT_391068 [Pyrenochaeta sp. DS3sAY3a]|nr:hypothetical protein IQ07DRAFT_391068 [Pyrenochaeta sp. DS3sAY3a]
MAPSDQPGLPYHQLSEESHLHSRHSVSQNENADMSQPTLPPPTEFNTLPPPPPPPPSASQMPPPPPPPFGYAPNPFGKAPGLKDNNFNADKIEQQHENLRDLQQDLLGHRFRLKASRKLIRNVREETGAKEGSAISQLRRFLSEQDIQLPPSIADAFEEVYALKDRLGLLESEYEDAEKDFNFQELMLAQHESQFVDSLFSGNEPPTTSFPPIAPIPGSNTMTSFALGSPEVWNTPDPELGITSGPELIVSTPHAASEIPHSEARPTPTPPLLMPGSDRAPSLQKNDLFFQVSQLSSDNFPSHGGRLKWADTKERVNQWLSDLISGSSLQRTQLELIQDGYGKDVVNNLSTGDPDATQFHTGDSTVPLDSSSKAISIPDLDNVEQNNLGSNSPQLGNSFPEEKNVDALEELNIPRSIQAGDLEDPSQSNNILPNPLQTLSTDETTPSVATEAADDHRNSDMEDVPSRPKLAYSYPNSQSGSNQAHQTDSDQQSESLDQSLHLPVPRHNTDTSTASAISTDSLPSAAPRTPDSLMFKRGDNRLNMRKSTEWDVDNAKTDDRGSGRVSPSSVPGSDTPKAHYSNFPPYPINCCPKGPAVFRSNFLTHSLSDDFWTSRFHSPAGMATPPQFSSLPARALDDVHYRPA